MRPYKSGDYLRGMNRSFHVEQPSLEPVVACPICTEKQWIAVGSSKDHTASGQEFKITSCGHCGFYATNPRPTIQDIGRYYIAPNYVSHNNQTRNVKDRVYRAVRKLTIRSKHKLIAGLKPNGRVLDLGCGTGEFLAYLKSKGYLVQGVEPGLTAREQAIANHALEVVPELGQVPGQEQFQVITLWHVLEHVHDLHETLKRLYARLSPGGFLIIAVPDRNSWDAQHYAMGWAAYDVPRHLSHFRQQDVHRLLGDHGFRPRQDRRMWFDAPYVSILSEQNKGRSPGPAFCLGLLFGLWSNAHALFGKPTSSTLYIAEKVV